MFSEIVSVVSWVGIALFLWSVSDSLSKIALAMHREFGTAPKPTGNPPVGA